MKTREKRQSGGMRWVVAVGLAALVGLAIGPALAGTVSAAPTTPSALASPSATQWAYGGQGYSNGSISFGAATLTWNSTFGWTVVFTATNTSNTTYELEEQRTVGVRLTTSLTAPNVSATYTYSGSAAETAFVNLTDNATVQAASGGSVAALGIENESLAAQSSVRQAMVVLAHGRGHSAYLNVSGAAHAKVSFAPALGLVPLNLSATPRWTANATATPMASWSFAYAWSDLGWNGTMGSGSGGSSGNWTAVGTVSVYGQAVSNAHVFRDHQPRTAIVISVQGPVDLSDGFVLVPHDFDLFGDATHPFDQFGFGSATVGFGSGETLFVSPSARGPRFTAASTEFAASSGAYGSLEGAPVGASSAATSSGPSGTVYGQPMSVASAQAMGACLTGSCAAAAAAPMGGLLLVAVIALSVVAVAGTVGAIAWRVRAHRPSGAPANASEPSAPRPPNA